MASSDDGFSFSAGDSLFEGMVLFDPSDLSSTPVPLSSSPPPPPLSIPPIPSDTIEVQSQKQPSRPPTPTSTSQPLDEDLFSDLTLLTPALPPTYDAIASSEIPRSNSPHPPPSRQISRKKKRAVRVGYAREAVAAVESNSVVLQTQESYGSVVTQEQKIFLNDPHLHPDASATSTATGSRSELPDVEDETPNHGALREVEIGRIVDDHKEKIRNLNKDHASVKEEVVVEEEEELSTAESADKEDTLALVEENLELPRHPVTEKLPATEVETDKRYSSTLVEEKLELIRSQIAQKLEAIQERAKSVLAERKELGRRRRKAAENVNSASTRYKELEAELEQACESEDFERAEMVSERLVSAEKEKDKLLGMLRETEADCDSVDVRLQNVLELQISAEEEGIKMLEQFSKDSANSADVILKNAQEISSREIEEWEMSSEALEIRKVEKSVELCLIDEARYGLESSIVQLVQDDRKEVERLSIRHDLLTKELDELLALVRLKEAEIVGNSYQMQEVEKRISSVVDKFQETQLNIDKKHHDLQTSLLGLESESMALSLQKNDIDKHLTVAQKTETKLRELARVSAEEARTCNDLVMLRKSLASPVLKSREDQLKLTKIETRVSDDIQMLRQQLSAARSSLQELSSNRSSIQEEISSFKQRMSFIDKRGPELEAEKKVAAAARNFKEAGRIAAEAKSLSIEKQDIHNKREKAVSDLEEIEGKINSTLNNIEETEGLITEKEKEVARARYERLIIFATAARAERFAALAVGDVEGGEIFLQEAEAAESKALELQQAYDFSTEELEKAPNNHISIALITNLAGKQLAEMASSLNLIALSHRCSQ